MVLVQSPEAALPLLELPEGNGRARYMMVPLRENAVAFPARSIPVPTNAGAKARGTYWRAGRIIWQGGGSCIAMVVVSSSPRAANSAPNAASRLSQAQSRHLLV